MKLRLVNIDNWVERVFYANVLDNREELSRAYDEIHAENDKIIQLNKNLFDENNSLHFHLFIYSWIGIPVVVALSASIIAAMCVSLASMS